MKTISASTVAVLSFVSVVFFAGSSASAATTRSVSEFREVSFDGTILTFTYEVKGGCEKHTGTIGFDMPSSSLVMTAWVLDSSDKEDMCEGIVPVTVTTNVHDTKIEWLKIRGLPETSRVNLILPQVSL